MSDDKAAKETEFLAGLGKGEHGDRVSVDVAMPPDMGLRLDFEHRAFDVDVVSLAGPHQGAVRSKDHRRFVVILGLMNDLDSLHESPFAKNFLLFDNRFPKSLEHLKHVLPDLALLFEIDWLRRR